MDGQLLILKLPGGNDRVGYVYADSDNPMFLRVECAATIRRWGTDAGLGQLALEGPRPNTALDPLPAATLVGVVQILEVITCDEAAWAGKGFAPRPDPALIGGG